MGVYSPVYIIVHAQVLPTFQTMRFFATAVAALCAAVVAAQNNAISVPAGQSTLDVTAGQPLTIEWTNPSSGTVTIKLQQDPITPDANILAFYSRCCCSS